jgi:hypothetical protein
VGKERWIETANALEPISRSLGLAAQAFELAARPADDKSVYPLQDRTQPRPVEVAVVVDPASNVRIVPLSQILQGHVTAVMQRPTPDRPADGRLRSRTDRGQVTDERATAVGKRLPCSEAKSEEVERLVQVIPVPVCILAIDGLRLFGM